MIVVANVLQPLIDVLHPVLRFFHDLTGSWGVAIIGLTVVVRLAILPLTFKGVKGMQELQRLQPQMKKLQERYADDRQRMQQEMMKLYQEHGVNPLSSCMPLLLQIPFFISIFYLLQGDEFQDDNRGEEAFLFITNLDDKESGGTLAALMVIYVVTQLGASLVTAISADRNQRLLMLGLPFVFVAIIPTFPAGLLVYWIATNVWTVGQQLAVKKFLPKPPPIEESKTGAKGSASRPEGKPARGRKAATAVSASDGGSADGGSPPRAGAAESGDGRRQKAPPTAPRKKKKRSGRRR